MITGENDSRTVYGELVPAGGSRLSGARTVNGVLDELERRRRNAEDGGANCIPLPFGRFRSQVPGIEQGQYVVVTAAQKTGKTSLASYVYLYSALDYAFAHRDSCSIHIIYFSLEEAVERVIERYMSHLLWELDGLRVPPSMLRSTSADRPVDAEVLRLLDSPRYRERLAFFEGCVEFDTEHTSPSGILAVCERYARSVGTVSIHTDPSTGMNVVDSYAQDDPNHYKMVIVDHIGLVDREPGQRTKDSVDRLSEYFVRRLRNVYNYTCVAIQQQASDSEGLEATRQKRMVPTAATLGDSKYTGRDADLVLGLFDPSRFGLPAWLGYTIQDVEGHGLRSMARFLYVIANRNGEGGGVCPLLFDGATCTFEELPLPTDVDALAAAYRKAEALRTGRNIRPVSLLALIGGAIREWKTIRRTNKK